MGGGGGGLSAQMTNTATATSGAGATVGGSGDLNSGAGNRGFVNNVAFPGATASNINPITQGAGATLTKYLPWLIVAVAVVIAIRIFKG